MKEKKKVKALVDIVPGQQTCTTSFCLTLSQVNRHVQRRSVQEHRLKHGLTLSQVNRQAERRSAREHRSLYATRAAQCSNGFENAMIYKATN